MAQQRPENVKSGDFFVLSVFSFFFLLAIFWLSLPLASQLTHYILIYDSFIGYQLFNIFGIYPDSPVIYENIANIPNIEWDWGERDFLSIDSNGNEWALSVFEYYKYINYTTGFILWGLAISTIFKLETLKDIPRYIKWKYSILSNKKKRQKIARLLRKDRPEFPSSRKLKKLARAKKRLKVFNKQFQVYPNDKEIQKTRKDIGGSFLGLDYYPAFVKPGIPIADDDNGRTYQPNESGVRDFVKNSITYTYSTMNLNHKKYEFALKLWEKMTTFNKYSNIDKYYIKWISLIGKETFDSEMINFTKTPDKENIDYTKSAYFYKLFQKSVGKEYGISQEISINNNKDNNILNDPLESIEIFNKSEKIKISIKELFEFFIIFNYKNKDTYENKVNRRIKRPPKLEPLVLENKDRNDKILKNDSTSKSNKVLDAIKNSTSKEEYETIIKNENEIRKHLATDKIKDLTLYYRYQVDKEVGLLRPVVPRYYILNPFNIKSGQGGKLKNFKCKGFSDILFPILRLLEKDFQEDIDVKINKLNKEIVKVQKDSKADPIFKDNMIDTIKLLIQDMKDMKGHHNKESRMFRLKKIFDTHKFEETIIIAMWEYGMEIDNLPTGRLSNLKKKNVTLWYALTSLGRPFDFIAGAPILTLYELEKKEAENREKDENTIGKNAPKWKEKANNLKNNKDNL